MRTTLLKFVLLFSLVLLNTSLSTGQIQYNNIRFKQLSIAEGLPHNTINAITQDNHGFIWFGTRNGLCRYDGYNINLFAHNEADSTSLRHNYITRLYNDSLRNILWISTDQGICSYNYETEDFSRYQIKGNTKDDVCFLNTSDGVLLAACSNGLYRYNEQDSLFVPFLLDEEKPHVRYLAEDGDKTLWIDTNKGLMRYSLEKKQFVSLPTLIQPFTQQCIETPRSYYFRCRYDGGHYVVSVDKETGKILAEQCEQPEDIFKLSDANLLFGMLGTRSYRSFPVWGRMEKDGLVQVVIPYELSLYEKGSTLTVPDELKKINVDSNPIFIVYKLREG